MTTEQKKGKHKLRAKQTEQTNKVQHKTRENNQYSKFTTIKL